MRRALLLLAAVLLLPGCALFRKPAWDRPPAPAADRPVVEPGALHRGELDNGVDVIVLEDRRLPRVSVGVAVRRGGGIVAPERAGLAAYTSELMRRGAGSLDALALARATDELGASLSVGADRDSMTVRVSGLARDLERLLEILADVALRPRFEPGEAAKARSEILASLERAKDDPATLAGWNLARALYAGHPYGTPAEGLPGTVARFDAGAARAFHRKVFVPDNAILFASGDVAMDELFPRLGEHFGAWEQGPVPPPGPAPPDPTPPERRVVVVDRPDLAQVRIMIGHEGLARTDPRRIGASIMNIVVGGGGFSSRLMEKLRSEAGLTYGVGSGFALRRHRGPFYVSTFTRVPEVRRAVDMTLAELQRARGAEPPNEDELRDAKALAVGRFALGLETSSAVLGSLVDLAVYDLPEDSLDTYRGRVRALTTDDTARLARELLHPDRAAIVLVGPAEAIVPQVEGLGVVEVVQP